MTNAILIFTFGPIQSFIAEARRASDLYVGSQILVQLAKAAAISIGKKNLIYPAQLTDDVPNVLVARIPFESAKDIAENAEESLETKWRDLANGALKKMTNEFKMVTDTVWGEIWDRQIANLWEVYWAASAEIDGYKSAYGEARRVLDSTKLTRMFNQVEEPGLKDSLSGCREALHTAKENGRNYWANASGLPKITAAKIRPGGREKLDAIGAIKRFSELAEKFPSVSTVSAADFLNAAERVPELASYRAEIEELFGNKIYRVSDNENWPYDGDLLFIESLTKQRLKTSYGLENPDESLLNKAKVTLRELYKKVDWQLSLYYAIIQLDGDSMGKYIDACLSKADPEKEHREFSKSISEFSGAARQIIGNYMGSTIYNGGDDVLALAPLSQALPLAQELAREFNRITKGCTASAGIAIVHRLYPLDAALQAAHEAEQEAKKVSGKNAICVRVLRRSGEVLSSRSSWMDVGDNYQSLVTHFKNKELSSAFAYNVLDEARIVTALENNARNAVLKRLVKRHKTKELRDPKTTIEIVEKLSRWADALDGCLPKEGGDDGTELPLQGFAELGKWLVVARFAAQGGKE